MDRDNALPTASVAAPTSTPAATADNSAATAAATTAPSTDGGGGGDGGDVEIVPPAPVSAFEFARLQAANAAGLGAKESAQQKEEDDKEARAREEQKAARKAQTDAMHAKKLEETRANK